MKEDKIYPTMVIRSQAEAIELLEKENKQLETNWKELNKYIEKRKDEVIKQTSHIYYDSLDKMHYVNKDMYDVYSEVSNKMQELERGNSNE